MTILNQFGENPCDIEITTEVKVTVTIGVDTTPTVYNGTILVTKSENGSFFVGAVIEVPDDTPIDTKLLLSKTAVIDYIKSGKLK